MGNTASQNFYTNCPNLNISNVVDINGIVNCAINVKGLESNSTSPSDTIIFDFVPGTNYGGEPISKGFQKIFITGRNVIL